MGTLEARDVYLTIVPTDFDEAANILDTIVDTTDEAPRLPVARTDETPKAAIVPLFAPAATPAPAPSRLPVAVAGLMGGVVIGGVGVAALAALLFLGVGAVATGAGLWWVSSGVAAVEAAPVVDELEAPVVEAPEAAPVEAIEAPVAAPEAPAAPKAPKESAPKAPKAPVAAPAAPAAPVDDAAEALPATTMVKLLSSPPAAVVLIDGVDVGRTPLKTELPSGTHAVTIQSGKATGTFSLDTGSAARFCFEAAGRKVSQTACE
jgi:hypothetical protein